MIDKKISIGSILTIVTAATTVVYMHAQDSTTLDNLETKQEQTCLSLSATACGS